MTTLALEFSSPHRSVAVARAGEILAEVNAAGGRATNAFSLIEQVLAVAKVRREDIEVIAVGVGPGSYTGIRAAIAVAQGWQLARDIKLLAVSSVDALAARARSENFFGRVNLIVDAQRGEFYLATWEISPLDCRELAPLKIVSAAEIERRQQLGERIIGPTAIPPADLWFPTAAAVAHLATGRSDFIPGEVLTPIYLRETNFVKTSSPKI